MAEPDDAPALDVKAMLQRFRERAGAVKQRNLPPVAGAERTKFIRQAEADFQDFAIIADSDASLTDGVLTLRIDLRPADQRSDLSEQSAQEGSPG